MELIVLIMSFVYQPLWFTCSMSPFFCGWQEISLWFRPCPKKTLNFCNYVHDKVSYLYLKAVNFIIFYTNSHPEFGRDFIDALSLIGRRLQWFTCGIEYRGPTTDLVENQPWLQLVWGSFILNRALITTACIPTNHKSDHKLIGRQPLQPPTILDQYT